MALFINTRRLLSNVKVERFWAIWWNKVDEILPPLLPEEVCYKPVEFYWRKYGTDIRYAKKAELKEFRSDVAQERDTRWAAAVEAAGYNGWDFQDVIKHHLLKFYAQARAYKQRRTSWRYHRLISRPRFILKRRHVMAVGSRSRCFSTHPSNSDEEWI
jgi:hypothetical protein